MGGDGVQERVPWWHPYYWFGWRWRERYDYFDGSDYSHYETDQMHAHRMLHMRFGDGRHIYDDAILRGSN